MNGNGIPYRLLGGIRFYDRREISLVINILKVLLNNDLIAFSRSAVTLIEGFGRQSASDVIDKSAENNEHVLLTLSKLSEERGKFNKPAVHDFVLKMSVVSEHLKKEGKLSSVIEKIVELFKMYDYWKNQEVDENILADRLDNINGLVSITRMFEENYDENDKQVFPDFLETTQLRDDSESEERETVKLMTVHKSKGMEFPYVFVAAVSEGVFPSGMALRTDDEKSIEEERRLFYVACTRAKDRLFLSYSQYPYGKYGKQMERSRFLDEVEGCFKEIRKQNYGGYGYQPKKKWH
jgi:DNA helicase-2/ATP-dependent DNA helicase PcrA